MIVCDGPKSAFVPVCDLIFKDILLLTLYDVPYILQLNTNYSTDPPTHTHTPL